MALQARRERQGKNNFAAWEFIKSCPTLFNISKKKNNRRKKKTHKLSGELRAASFDLATRK